MGVATGHILNSAGPSSSGMRRSAGLPSGSSAVVALDVGEPDVALSIGALQPLKRPVSFSPRAGES